jgi:DNA-binding SARP family transcriptional activator
MACLQISLFGRFDVRVEGQSLTGLDVRKTQELFGYLLLHRDRPHPREKLADLLWGEIPTSRSRGYLRKTLWQLQTALDPDGRSLEASVLLVEPDWVQLNPGATLWLDVARFEAAFERAKGRAGKTLTSQCVGSLQDAAILYQGDLLEGWYQDWCLFERERLQRIYLIMLDKLMGYCEAHHQYEAGLVYGNLLLGIDRARERTHRRLMRLYYLGDDRTAALRQYRQCVTALKDELGVEPARRTVQLYDKICTDEYGGIEAVSPGATGGEPGVLTSALAHLKSAQAILIDTQRQLERDIEAIDMVLGGAS